MPRTCGAHERSFAYERHRPERTPLYRALQSDLEPFLARLRDQDRELPRFVRQQLRGYLRCGILGHGFVRVRCTACGHNRAVAFSCKGRGFCPSCGGRRMAETAARLVDHVIPEAPVRQWVLSLPVGLRYLLAYDREACNIALRTFIEVVFAYQRKRARARGIRNPEPGGVTFIQRFASSLALNLHFHSLLLDGIYCERDDGTVRFVPLPPPTDDEIATLTRTVGRRIHKTLVKAGKLRDDHEPDALATNDPTRAALYGASVQHRIATGPRTGHPVERIGDRVTPEEVQHKGPRCAQLRGFSLHANVAVPARDRKRLERLCRYMARPPLASERLTEQPDGTLRYDLRKPWRDGTRAFVFTPDELIEKLVALIPPPQFNMLRYHGVLAPASKLRAKVVRDRRPAEVSSEGPRAVQRRRGGTTDFQATPRTPWADLLKRVFAIDVLALSSL